MPAKIYTEHVVVNGRGYTLQHPGVAHWKTFLETCTTVDTQTKQIRMNLSRILDYGFKNVVFPDSGPRLKYDEWDALNQEELDEVWLPLLQAFLRRPQLENRTYTSSNWRATNPEEEGPADGAEDKNDLLSADPANRDPDSGGRAAQGLLAAGDRGFGDGGHGFPAPIPRRRAGRPRKGEAENPGGPTGIAGTA